MLHMWEPVGGREAATKGTKSQASSVRVGDFTTRTGSQAASSHPPIGSHMCSILMKKLNKQAHE